MRWRRQWPEKPPRPKLQSLSEEQKQKILQTLSKGVAASPVLCSLGIRVRSLRGRFYFERVWQDSDAPEVEVIGRVTPLAKPEGVLLLEVESTQGNWSEIVRGSARKVINAIADDTKGTFHGLGALDQSLRKVGDRSQRLAVKMQPGFRFVYSETGKNCTVQEALYHFFEVPIEIIAEPREWYSYHRQPQVVEVSQDRTQILVRFTAMSLSGEYFGGTCLYMKKDDAWHAFRIRPNQSESIETAVAWLEKRKWKDW
jgi:hypothetical protein